MLDNALVSAYFRWLLQTIICFSQSDCAVLFIILVLVPVAVSSVVILQASFAVERNIRPELEWPRLLQVQTRPVGPVFFTVLGFVYRYLQIHWNVDCVLLILDLLIVYYPCWWVSWAQVRWMKRRSVNRICSVPTVSSIVIFNLTVFWRCIQYSVDH